MSDPRRTTATYPVRSNSNAIEWVYDRTKYGWNEGLIMEGAMSVMPAIELTCGSDIRPVRVLGPVGAPSGVRADGPDGPGDTPGVRHAALTSRRDTPEIGRDTPAARSSRQCDTSSAPLRLTRRGRVVVATAAV